MRLPVEIPPGLVSDDTSHSAAGRWRDGANVRFWRGQAQVVGGWERLCDPAVSGVCRTVLGWSDRKGGLNVAFGTHSNLQVWRGGSLFDVTPAGLAAGPVDGAGGEGYGTGAWSTGGYSEPSAADFFPRTWSLAAWGENLLASPRGGGAYLWANNPAVAATPVAGAPARISHLIVAPTDQVFALGCDEEASGAFNPLCIRHSGVRSLSEWTTGPATTAREIILPGGGRIVAGRTLGSNILVWTSHALFVGTFVGSVTQPWRFDRVGERCGLIGPNAAVVVGQSAWWLGPDLQFYRYLLGGAPEPIPCPIRDALVDNLAAAQGDKVVASSISSFGEVRFDYPDARDGHENSRSLSVSTIDGSWSRGDVPRTALVDAGPSEHPIAVDPHGAVFLHERGASADGAPFSWFLDSADQALDEQTATLARGVWPDFADQAGPVFLTLSARFKPQGPETVCGPFAIAPGQERIDLRLSGRLFRIRLEGRSSPTSARLGRMVFDGAPAGSR